MLTDPPPAGMWPLALGGTALVGAMTAHGWAPVAFPALSLIGYGWLFAVLAHWPHPARGLAAGFLFALALQLSGQGWVFDALRLRGQGGDAHAFLGSALFFTYLASFTALPAAAACLFLSRRRARSASLGTAWQGGLVFAALLTLGEWARSLLFNGVTGLSLGYALVPTSAAGWLPVTGVYGLGFLGYWLAAALARLVAAASLACLGNGGTGSLRGDLAVVLGAAGCLFAGGEAWTQYAVWVYPHGPSLSFRLIQSHADPLQKFQLSEHEVQARRVTQALVAQSADLIVTPETALTQDAARLGPPFWGPLASFAQRTRSHLFVGVPTRAADGRGFNSVFHVGPGSAHPLARYDKIGLMPVGEYAPAGLGWFTRRMTLSMKDLSQGEADQAPFPLSENAGRPPVMVAALVCHEDGRGRNLRRSLPAAHLFINPTDLSWFDGSSALEQGLQVAQARALEAGRPFLRTANGGITAHIDHRAKVQSRLAPGGAAVLSGWVQPMAGQTPYARLGDWPTVVACLFIVGGLGWPRRHARPGADRIRG